MVKNIIQKHRYSKGGNMELKRSTELEKQYLRVYNREVEIASGKTLDDNGVVKVAVAEIKSPKGNTYKLTEHLVDGATDFVLVDIGNKQHRYKTYLEAEVNVAYLIGGEK